ncbi:hypothetical protein KQR54_18230 [Mycobacterium gordonae]|nr:hypothetical protein [Mycobacterium gordonae]
MLKVALVHGPYDNTGGDDRLTGSAYVMETGYLVDGHHVMYLKDGDLWVDPVRRVEGRETLFIPSDTGAGIKLATGVTRGDSDVIREVYTKLMRMTGWYLLTNFLIPGASDVELDLPK